MAGDNDSYIRIRVPDRLRLRFRRMCDARGADMSKMVRNLLEGACTAADAGDPLIAPVVITSRKNR